MGNKVHYINTENLQLQNQLNISTKLSNINTDVVPTKSVLFDPIEESLFNFQVLEIGCGSGALTLALLKHLQQEPIEFTAVDAMEHAVRLTKDNALSLGFNFNTTDQVNF